jgi:prevent-host-death family protein
MRQIDEKVGIRELRLYLSVYLRRVAKGSRFTITDHNVPVAKLVPLGREREETWEELKRRSLDAIHLVTAMLLYPHVSPFITYDRRLAAVAGAVGLEVASPR